APISRGERKFAMVPKEVERLASQVVPSDARSYALAQGWRRLQHINGNLAVFSRGDGSLDQLLIPLEPSAPDYPKRILDVARNLAEFEHRSLYEILNDLLMPDADIVRFKVSSPQLTNDLSLIKGIEILEGAKRAILSSAH